VWSVFRTWAPWVWGTAIKALCKSISFTIVLHTQWTNLLFPYAFQTKSLKQVIPSNNMHHKTSLNGRVTDRFPRENLSLLSYMGWLGSEPRLVGPTGSGVRVSASFPKQIPAGFCFTAAKAGGCHIGVCSGLTSSQ